MKLKLIERFRLLQILPKEGSFATLKIVQMLKSSLALSEVEFKEYEVKDDGASITWNPKKDFGSEILIGEKATDIIVSALKKLDKEQGLTEQDIPLYEMFVRGDECTTL